MMIAVWDTAGGCQSPAQQSLKEMSRQSGRGILALLVLPSDLAQRQSVLHLSKCHSALRPLCRTSQWALLAAGEGIWQNSGL